MKRFVALLLVILLFSGCSKNKEDLTQMAEEKDSEGLIEFISDNMQNEEKMELVEFAIDEIISKDLAAGKEFIEKVIRDGNPQNFIDKALNSYSYNNKQFESIDSMLENYFSIVNQNKDIPYLKTYRSVLTSGDRKLIAGKIRNIFIKTIDQSNIKLSVLAAELLVKDLKFSDSLSQRMSFLVNKTLIFMDNEKDSFMTYVNNVYISELEDSIKNHFSEKRSSFSDEWSRRNPEPEGTYDDKSAITFNDPYRDDKVSNNNNEDDNEFPPSEALYLSGYIVHQSNLGKYEIIVQGQKNRAILNTRYTTFTNKGSFSLPVKKTGTQTVSLKEEYGGFTQEWNTYTEVKPKYIKRWQNYKNREVLMAQYKSLVARTLTPALEALEREELREIAKLKDRKSELAKAVMEQYESYKREIIENYKKCFIL